MSKIYKSGYPYAAWAGAEKRLQNAQDTIFELRKQIAALEAERDAWQEFAEHQITCAACADNVYDCDTALGLMVAIDKVSKTANIWINIPDVDDFAAALGKISIDKF